MFLHKNVADNVFSEWISQNIFWTIIFVIFTNLRVGDIIHSLYLLEI